MCSCMDQVPPPPPPQPVGGYPADPAPEPASEPADES